MKNIRSIAIFRALQVGDMLCAIPSIRALRNKYPDATITLIGLPWARWLIGRFPNYFDDFIEFSGWPGLPEQKFHGKTVLSFLKKVQAKHFDLIIQMHGNGTYINEFISLCDAKSSAGFYTQNGYSPDKNLYMLYPNSGSEIMRHIKLMEFLKIPSQGTNLEFPLSEDDNTNWNDLKKETSIGERYVIIHPGARAKVRQWEPKNFALIADYCREKGFDVVLTGTKDEAIIIGKVMKATINKAIDISNKTSLGVLGAAVQQASLVISNDTGIAHIAAAMETSSIIISQGIEVERWSPLNFKVHTVIVWPSIQHINTVFQTIDKKI